jgi:hypothetical protein
MMSRKIGADNNGVVKITTKIAERERERAF